MRLLAIVMLLGVLLGLLVWYGSLGPAPAAGEYVGADELGQGYDRYVDHRVSVGGTVVQTDPVVIATTQANDTLLLRVTNVSHSVSEGAHLAVFGIAQPNRTIHALNTQTTPRYGLWYAYLTSFGAGLWVLGRGLRSWRINWKAKAIERRGAPITWRQLLTLIGIRSEAQDDA